VRVKFPMVGALAILAATTSCSDQPDGGSPRSASPPKVAPVAVAPAPKPAPPVTVNVPPTTAARPSRKAAPTRTIVIEELSPPFTRSTLSGVYTAAEAKDGKDLYLGFCASCHSAVSHTGPAFRLKWAGRPLSELFAFMRTNMPKNDPASLDDEQYGLLLAYLLQMNRMPAGKTPLSPDPGDLAKIRIDTVLKN
jgi:S-disulfanyl-L-cysteine oxidoreductase SoxD